MRFWDGWLDRIAVKEHGKWLAAFRIALAAIVFVDTLSLLLADVVDPLYRPISEGGLAPADRFWSPWIDLFGHTMTSTWGLFAALLLFSGLVLIGLGGRLTAFLLLQAVLVLHAIPEDIGGGYDRLLTNGLFLLVLGDSTATWSVDCRLRTGHWTSSRKVYAFARYIGIFQLCLVYVVTGLKKRGYGWYEPWDAVYYSLQRLSYTRYEALPWLGDVFVLTQIGTVLAYWWEVGFVLAALWWGMYLGWVGPRAHRLARRFDLRWPFLGVGLIVHGVLGLLMNLGPFTVVTWSFYLLWLDPPQWRNERGAR